MKVEFVESAPRPLSEGVLYISDRFRTALHLCCCGCGREVVTPLNPAGWAYKRDAGTVTLKPSIGNWSFPCRSHYLIIKNEVVWAKPMTAQQIAMVKAKDAHAKKVLIDRSNATKTSAKIESLVASGLTSLAGEGLFIRVRRWLGM
ncbi:MAG TPA: DUF6527 family protein [Polaromonas sp.]|nr:DUF6527 family protein [Polaromonas sp.]